MLAYPFRSQAKTNVWQKKKLDRVWTNTKLSNTFWSNISLYTKQFNPVWVAKVLRCVRSGVYLIVKSTCVYKQPALIVKSTFVYKHPALVQPVLTDGADAIDIISASVVSSPLVTWWSTQAGMSYLTLKSVRLASNGTIPDFLDQLSVHFDYLKTSVLSNLVSIWPFLGQIWHPASWCMFFTPLFRFPRWFSKVLNMFTWFIKRGITVSISNETKVTRIYIGLFQNYWKENFASWSNA